MIGEARDRENCIRSVIIEEEYLERLRLVVKELDEIAAHLEVPIVLRTEGELGFCLEDARLMLEEMHESKYHELSKKKRSIMLNMKR